MKRSKYRAKPVTIDGLYFASTKEGKRYQELKLLQAAGEITNLIIQPKFPVVVEGCSICTYIADFQYDDVRSARRVVEDVKGVRTPVYRLKKKLVEAVHSITITEV